MGRRASRHAKTAARISVNNKDVKGSAGKNAFFAESRKRAETDRIIKKYSGRT